MHRSAAGIPGTLATVSWQMRVDRWWADILGLPVVAVESGGLFAIDDIDHVGVLEVPGRASLVYASPDVAAVLEGERTRPGVGVGQAAVGVLGGRVTRVVGPTWYGYATAHALTGSYAGVGVRELTSGDLDALAELHEQTPREEVNESGTDELPAFGIFDDSRLIAVACLKSWHQMPTIAVLTHPDYRGRGLATHVVAAAARAGLQHRSEVQYRAFHANAASIAVARSGGFRHYGDLTVIECSVA
jgi:GNAT superfamily N-acetyltransferase